MVCRRVFFFDHKRLGDSWCPNCYAWREHHFIQSHIDEDGDIIEDDFTTNDIVLKRVEIGA
jgi:hypothetical protein